MTCPGANDRLLPARPSSLPRLSPPPPRRESLREWGRYTPAFPRHSGAPSVLRPSLRSRASPAGAFPSGAWERVSKISGETAAQCSSFAPTLHIRTDRPSVSCHRIGKPLRRLESDGPAFGDRLPSGGGRGLGLRRLHDEVVEVCGKVCGGGVSDEHWRAIAHQAAGYDVPCRGKAGEIAGFDAVYSASSQIRILRRVES